MSKVTPLRKLDRARLWATTILRDVADRIDAAPAQQARDALVRLAAPLAELERQAALVLPGGQQ